MAYTKPSEAELLRQLQAEGIGKNPAEVYINQMTVLADQITEEFKEGIRNNTKNGSGALAQSITSIPTRDGFTINGDFYFKFVDDGVDGVGETGRDGEKKRPGGVVIKGTPYKFKKLTVGANMEKSIAEWSGRSIGSNYGTGINIKKYGIKPHDITEKVMTDELLENIAEDLATLTGLVVGVVFDKALKDPSKK